MKAMWLWGLGLCFCSGVAWAVPTSRPVPKVQNAKPMISAKAIQGQWVVVSMKRKRKVFRLPPEISIAIHFGAAQKYRMVMVVKKKVRKRVTGSWQVKAGVLHTITQNKRKESSRLRWQGKELVLTSKSGVLYLQRRGASR